MELRHLRYFVAVAETGSLTVAAEQRLFTSQPSLSRQIRDLEDEVRTELFSRSARGVELTASGKAFLDHAMSLGAETIATGHYARVRERDGRFELLKAFDHTKDQSYFLHRLNQAQLSKTMFPLGEIPKTKVREIAEQIGLPNAKKKDSTGICFIGERPFRDFLNRYLPTQPGPMKTTDGKTVGEHIGLAFYTFGQRKGIGLGGSKDGSGEPWFVAGKDIESNTLYVAQGHDHPWLLSHTLTAGNTSWVAGHAPEVGHACAAKTRYRQADAACTFGAAKAGADPDTLFSLHFADAQWAVTPGQSAVLYDGDVCLGGGIIEHAATAQPVARQPQKAALLTAR